MSAPVLSWMLERLRSGEARIEHPPPFTPRQARRLLAVVAAVVAAAVLRSVLGG